MQQEIFRSEKESSDAAQRNIQIRGGLFRFKVLGLTARDHRWQGAGPIETNGITTWIYKEGSSAPPESSSYPQQQKTSDHLSIKHLSFIRTNHFVNTSNHAAVNPRRHAPARHWHRPSWLL